MTTGDECEAPELDGSHTPCDHAPCWLEVGRRCTTGRRSLWYRKKPGALEIRAGREGDDAVTTVRESSPHYRIMVTIMDYARFAHET